MKEIWKTIGEFDNYEVSNKGRVRNKETKNVLRPYLSNSGYYMINLVNDKYRKNNTIHRLVAKTFIENKQNKEIVNHIDHDKLNNQVDNLEWVTQKENCKHSIGAGRANTHTARESLSKVSKKPVYQKDMEGNVIKLWDSPTQAEKESDKYYRAASIGRVANGQRNSYKGYKWEFVNKSSNRSRTLFVDLHDLNGKLLHECISVHKALKIIGKDSSVAFKRVVARSEKENIKAEYNNYLVSKSKNQETKG